LVTYQPAVLILSALNLKLIDTDTAARILQFLACVVYVVAAAVHWIVITFLSVP